MSKNTKKGWCFFPSFIVAVVMFICFSYYINKSTLEENLSQNMQNNGTNMVSYQLYSYHSSMRNQLAPLNHSNLNNVFYMFYYHLFKSNASLGADPVYLVKAANEKQYYVEVSPNHSVVLTTKSK